MSERPLYNNLGFTDFGKYKLDDYNTYNASNKLNGMWNQEIYGEISKDGSKSDGINDGDNDDDTNKTE